MFTVEVDLARRRIIVTLLGFASVEDVQTLTRDLELFFNRLPRGVGYQVLYDVSDADIQSQEVVGAMRALVMKSPPASAFAMINASALAGRQLRRIFEGTQPTTFEDRSLALSWLDQQ